MTAAGGLFTKAPPRRRSRLDPPEPRQLDLGSYLRRVTAPIRWRRPKPRSSAMEAAIAVEDEGTKRGATYATLCKILRHDERILGAKPLRFDQMTTSPVHGDVRLDDAAIGRLRERLELVTRLKFGAADIESAVHQLSWENRFQPVAEYLRGLKWDGVERLAYVAGDVLGIANPTELTQTMLRKWFIAAVARPLLPGCKVDNVLILTGPQGIGKSTFFATLAGEKWFSDSPIDLQNKDALLAMRRVWILEWSELESMQRARDYATVKAFITSCVDHYRAPYSKRMTEQPRHCVIVGTTNDDEFLSDPTGNRRYWIIRIEDKIDTEQLGKWREQLWAEAVHLYRAGERWYLNEAQEQQLREMQADYIVRDPWEEPILAFVRGTALSPITTGLVLEKAIAKPTTAITTGDQRRVARILRRAGWRDERRRNESGEQYRVWTPAPRVTDVTDGDGCESASSVTANPSESAQVPMRV